MYNNFLRYKKIKKIIMINLKRSDAIQSTLIGALFLVAGIYVLAGYNIMNYQVFWVLVCFILIVKCLSFIRV